MEFEVWFPQSYHPAIKSNLKKFQEIPVAGSRNKVQWNKVYGNKVHVFFIARIRSMSKFYTFWGLE